MHTLVESKLGFTVGYFRPNTQHLHVFIPLFDYKRIEAAAAAVNYLNGGQASFPTPQEKEIPVDPKQQFKNGMAVVMTLIAARHRSCDASLEIEYSPVMYRISRRCISGVSIYTEWLTDFVPWDDSIRFLNGYGVKS